MLGRASHAREALQTALDRDPTRSEIRDALAFLLATTPVDSVRDGPRALALAERVVAEDGGGWGTLSTLAAALAEVGRFGEAVRTIEEAQELLSDQIRTTQREGGDTAGLLSRQRILESALQAFRSNQPYRTPR